ncbi:MAG TPA: hypothetical protein VFY04_04355 [Solirubrobacterales bacterium]|nr:hypothetical protein [Solirubrobacterales bacterium]
MGLSRTFAPIVALALVLTACGSTSDATPVACLDGPAAYVGALGDAPGGVKLNGEAAISECLAENQQGGDLATVGRSMVEAATQLNAEAREGSGSRAALRLGYMLGAAANGAEETGGIHADLLRRLDAAARYRLRPAQAFRTGYAAGQDHG